MIVQFSSTEPPAMCFFCNSPTFYRYHSVHSFTPVCPVCALDHEPSEINPAEAEPNKEKNCPKVVYYEFGCGHRAKPGQLQKHGMSLYATVQCPQCGEKECTGKMYSCLDCGDEFFMAGSSGHGQPRYCSSCKIERKEAVVKASQERRKERGYANLPKNAEPVRIDRTPPNILDYIDTGAGNLAMAQELCNGGY